MEVLAERSERCLTALWRKVRRKSLGGIHVFYRSVASYPGLLAQRLSLAVLTRGKAW